ncbi:MAG: AAA family ATPase [Proteobacteria bacterium]|nr:AAA family ATPase [Pseudomonadota bacterium]
MLYLDHFGLDEPPFRITPHTDFFFDGADRGATLDALLYAILHDEGIVKVSGEVGSGKTMLCRVLMERLPGHVEIVYLANPSLARDEILHAISDDLKTEFSKSRITVALRELEEHLIGLYAGGRRVVILIDEAHAMPEETLEQVRLLSNLESNRHKLLQIVLFGQTELDVVLDKISMRQLKDRITHSFRMRPLSEAEVGKYLSFRMRAAGYRGPDIFSPRAVAMIAKAASGLTRRVNILADKALLAAFTENKHAVTDKQARAAIRDSEFGRLLHERRRNPVVFAGVALLAGLILGAGVQWWLARGIDATEPAPVASKTPAAVPVANPSQPSVPPPSAESPPTPAALPAAPSGPAPAPAPQPAVPQGSATPDTKARPGTLAEATTSLGADAVQRLAGYKPGPNPLLKERISAMRERLEREPDGSYSIELFSTDNSDPARVERFLVRARELVPLDQVLVLPQLVGNRYRIRVAYGAYPDRAAAAQAADRLPPKYKQAFQTELRSYAELRAGL